MSTDNQSSENSAAFPVSDQKDAPKPPDVPDRDPSKGLPDPQKVDKWQYAKDVAERTIATYLEALVALLLAADKLDMKLVTASAVAAIPAGLSVIKAGMARFLGDPKSAALLRKRKTA